MFILAWNLFQERIGYWDTASYMLEIMKKDDFAIVHGRYGAALSQFIPLILFKLNAPLKAIMIGYSLNFILLYAVCFWFCLSICRHRHAAYAICFFMVLSLKFTYFWPVSELFQSLVMAISFWAWWDSPVPRARRVQLFIGLVLFLLAFVTHAVSATLLAFFLAYGFLNQVPGHAQNRWYDAALLLATIPLAMLLKETDHYESTKMLPVLQVFDYLPEILEMGGGQIYLDVLRKDYHLLALAFFIVPIGLILQQKWLKLLLVLSFSLGYALILVMAYPFCDTQVLVENLLLPFSCCLMVVFCHEILFSLDRFYFPQFVLGLALFLFMVRISPLKGWFKDKELHFQTIANSIQDSPQRKLVFSEKNYPMDISMFSWATFAESLLFSGLQDPDNCFTVFVTWEYRFPELLSHPNGPDLILDYPWAPFAYQRNLPKRYFNLPQQTYAIQNPLHEVSVDSFLILLPNVQMEWVDPSTEFHSGQKKYVGVKIKNNNSDPIPSRFASEPALFISYRFFFEGELVNWEPPRRPLLMDIDGEVEQLVFLELPEQEEKIEIQFGLVARKGDEMYVTSDRYPVQIKP